MYSSGKSIAAIVAALMVDRGLLNYDDKIVTYWPEFGKNGKEGITVKDILRHEAGLAHIRQTLNVYDTLKDNLKDNAIGEMIEKCKPFFLNTCHNHDGTPSVRAYHAVSRGWIINEIVRRVDDKKRTIGEILERDINIRGIHCGLNDRDLKNTRCFGFISPLWVLIQVLLPERFGKRIEYGVWHLIKGAIAYGILSIKKDNIIRHLQNVRTVFRPLFSKKRRKFYLFDPFIYGSDSLIRGETPSVSCNGSARGMAKLASTVANRGIGPDGQMFFSEDTWEKMHQDTKLARDGLIGTLKLHLIVD